MKSGRSAMPALLAGLGIALLLALGIWQLERRSWKLQLIDRVGQRVHAPITAAPGPDRWPLISISDDEYRHVEITGEYSSDGQVLVQALTRLGGGYWVLTPLRHGDGSVVLINRGFVPTELRDQPARFEPATGSVGVTGLLRISEPRGRLLRRNVPAEQRWYSRDVGAIATAGRLRNVAPYFIDADASVNAVAGGRDYPVGGLTVISFPNNHLLYAITWFSLALLGAVTVAVGRRQRIEHEYRAA